MIGKDKKKGRRQMKEQREENPSTIPKELAKIWNADSQSNWKNQK